MVALKDIMSDNMTVVERDNCSVNYVVEKMVAAMVYWLASEQVGKSVDMLVSERAGGLEHEMVALLDELMASPLVASLDI
jgi:hypothetical protein